MCVTQHSLQDLKCNKNQRSLQDLVEWVLCGYVARLSDLDRIVEPFNPESHKIEKWHENEEQQKGISKEIGMLDKNVIEGTKWIKVETTLIAKNK